MCAGFSKFMRSLINDETYKFTKNIVQKKHCQMYSIAYIVKIIEHISLLHIDAFPLSCNTVYLYHFFPFKTGFKSHCLQSIKRIPRKKKIKCKEIIRSLRSNVYKIYFIF